MRPMLPYVVIFIGALAAAGGALWATLEQHRSSLDLLGKVMGGDSFVYLQPLRNNGEVR